MKFCIHAVRGREMDIEFRKSKNNLLFWRSVKLLLIRGQIIRSHNFLQIKSFKWLNGVKYFGTD